MNDTQKIEQFLYHGVTPFYVAAAIVLILVIGIEIGLQCLYSPAQVEKLTPQEIIERSPDVFGSVAARVRAANLADDKFERKLVIFGGSTVMAALVSDEDLHNIANDNNKSWDVYNLALPSLMLDEATYLSSKLNLKENDVVLLAADLGRFNQGRKKLWEKFNTYPEVMFSDPSRTTVIKSVSGVEQPTFVDSLIAEAILPRLYANLQNHVRRCFSVNSLGNFRPSILVNRIQKYLGGAEFCDSYIVFFNDEMFKARKVLNSLQIDTSYPKTLYHLNFAYQNSKSVNFEIFKTFVNNLKDRGVVPVIYFPPKSAGYFLRWGQEFDQHAVWISKFAENTDISVIDHSRDYLDQSLYSDFSHFNRPLNRSYSENLVADIVDVLN